MIKSYNNLKRKIIIALFLVFTISVNFVIFSHLIDQSNSSIKDQEKSFELYNLKVSGQEINITSPENKTYTRPMGGYYPATYGFENDIISAPPQGLSSEVGTGTIIEVIDQLDGHNMITRLYDGAIGENIYANLSHTFLPKSTGVIEFWFRRSGIQEVIFFELWNETNYGLTVYSEDWSGGLAFEYYNGTDYVTIMSHNSDQWYHHRLDFDCINGTFDWYIDGVLRGDDLLLRDPTPYFVRFTVRTRGWGSTGYNAYIDGLGISWDINYNIGDNLNEGLLLSYDNSTNLDWQGYSLDGQPNKTILGNTAIQMPQKGSHTIQIFGNDSIGTMYESNIRHFSIEPLTIITPENKTYTEPMSGYYPATYGFENDVDGSDPNGWTVTETGGDIDVISGLDNHKKIVKMYRNHATADPKIYNDIDAQSSGTIEFWLRTTDNSKVTGVYIQSSSGTVNSINIQIDDGQFQNNYGPAYETIKAVNNNQWYHHRIEFDCAVDTFDWYIDGVLEGDDLSFRVPGDNVDRIAIYLYEATSYTSYFDAFGYSWEPSYSVGDNKDEGLLLSYETTENLEWIGYSLDEQANKTVLGNSTIPMPDYGEHNIQIFGNNTFGTYHQSDLVYFSYALFRINSPENITYTNPMNGYYPGTYGFEETEGTTSTNINFIDTDLSGSGSTPSIISGVSGHEKVLELNDNSGSTRVDIRSSFNSTTGSGTIEWYWRTTNVNNICRFDVHNSGSARIRVGIWNNFLNYWDGTNQNIVGIASDTWYHLRIDFESDTGGYQGLSADTYYLYLNGVQYGPYNFASDVDYLDGIRISTHDTQTGYNNYIDALGYSWDQNYNIGDNLQEGLLLSFENNIALDWIGYSLDGQANRTILGNTTIPLPDDGSHTIQIFGNDSIGTIYESVIRNFAVDVTPPIISINSPTANQFFGTIAPDFDISITELNLHTTWYTIDNGITNITFTGFTGTINQIEWDKAGEGSIMIRFYANDTVSHENFIDIMVFKGLTSVIVGPGINFLLIFIMIGTFSLLGVVVFSIVYKKVYVPSRKPKHRKVKVKKVKARKKIIQSLEIFCPFCNSVITSEQKFCKYCGSNLKEAENN